MNNTSSQKMPPDILCHDIFFCGTHIGTCWATLISAGRTHTVTGLLQMKNTPSLALKASRKRSITEFNEDWRPKCVVIEDSNGNRAETRLGDEQMAFNGAQVMLDEPITLSMEANQFSVMAYQLQARSDRDRWRDVTLIPDTGSVMPLTFDRTTECLSVSLGQSIQFGDDGLVSQIDFAQGDVSVIRTNRTLPKWPTPLGKPRFSYSAPSDIRIEDVEIKSPDYDAGATIARPLDNNDTAAVAVFVGGTGACTRHGFTPRVDIGTHQLLDDLARTGIASVRYDKFDRRARTGEEAESSQDFERLCLDASRWLNWLDGQAWVRNLPRIVIGHSLGGLVALELSARRKDINAAVCLNTPGRPFRQMVQSQRLWIQSEIPSSETAREKSDEAQRAFIAALESVEEWTEDSVPASVLPFRGHRALFSSILDLDPQDIVKESQTPLLIVQGARDLQVSVEDAVLLKKAAVEVDRPYELIIEDGLDHHLKRNRKTGMAAFMACTDGRRRIPVALIRRISKTIRVASASSGFGK